MNDQGKNKIAACEENPLVTFALFAYNQERYIREAIEGALAQTYSPLEIIISDDHSTDKTYEIARGLVSNYQGSHRILLNRNKRNLGIGEHIKYVVSLSGGEILVLAAGDDISKPERTEVVTQIFHSDSQVFSVFTDVSSINEHGEIIDAHFKRWEPSQEISLPILARNGGGIGTGAGYAYRRKCFEWPWSYPGFIVSEDRLLPFRAACLGIIKHISLPLVFYRITPGSLSTVLSQSDNLAMLNEQHLNELNKTLEAALNEDRITSNQAKLVRRIVHELPKHAHLIKRVLTKRSSHRLFFARVIDNWFNRDSLWQRLRRKFYN